MESLNQYAAAENMRLIGVAYAALSSAADFKNGKVDVLGKKVGVFADAFAFAKHEGGKLATVKTSRNEVVWAFVSYDGTKKQVNIAIRGTVDLDDWRLNFSGIDSNAAVPLTDWKIDRTVSVRVRLAWLDLYRTVGPAIIRTVNEILADAGHPAIELLNVTGHSLGAALGTLLAAELPLIEPGKGRRVSLMSFASPRVGSDSLLNHLNSKNVDVWRIFASRDPVTRVPAAGSIVIDGKNEKEYLDHVGTPFALFNANLQIIDGVVRAASQDDAFLWKSHSILTYARSLAATFSAMPQVSISPDFKFGSVLLEVRTGDSWWAGTDSDVYVECLGQKSLLDYAGIDDFKTSSSRNYLIPLNRQVNIEEFMKFPLKFSMMGTDSWQLRSVVIRVGSGFFEVGRFGQADRWEEDGWAYLGPVAFHDQEIVGGKAAIRSGWPLKMQEQLLLPALPIRIASETGKTRLYLSGPPNESTKSVKLMEQHGEQDYPYQTWTIQLAASSPPAYFIQNNFSRNNQYFVLDAANSRLGDTSELLVWPRHDSLSKNQLWLFEPIGGGRFLIRSLIDDRFALERQDGDSLKLRKVTGSEEQIFLITGLRHPHN
jgi:Lipase (class 3)